MNNEPSIRELERLREAVTARLGLAFPDEQLQVLAGVASKRMRALGLHALPEYLAHLSSPPSVQNELCELAKLLTVPETYFFRGDDQFRALADRLQQRAASGGRRVRILSAGCASGEEPYSIVMALRESLRPFEAWDISVDAFDANTAMLEKAKRGCYGAWSLRATSEALKSRYFTRKERDFQVVESVRSGVRFAYRNLADELPLVEGDALYDAIFCRNVLMYFDPQIARRIVARFERALAPGGLLFLGHAETMRGLSEGFRLCHTHGAFYYESAGAAVEAPAALAAPVLELEAGPYSWVDRIAVASQRVHLLTQRSAESAGIDAIEEQVGWDLGQVTALLREERFDEALEFLHALPPASQSSAEVLLLRALTLTNKGAGGAAEAACRRLLEVDAASAGAHYLLALCREQRGDCAGASECDRRSIQLDTTFAMAHLHLGLLAKRDRDRVLARAELERALHLLDQEDTARLLLFGGGFSRMALMKLCAAELAVLGAER